MSVIRINAEQASAMLADGALVVDIRDAHSSRVPSISRLTMSMSSSPATTLPSP